MSEKQKDSLFTCVIVLAIALLVILFGLLIAANAYLCIRTCMSQ